MAGGLKRALTLPQLVIYAVGTMVGAGIYSVIGAAAGAAGTFLFYSFLLAGLAAFLTVLSYAELASAMPRAGAEYQYVKAAFPGLRLAAFMAGVLIALNTAATSATVALAFGGYLQVFVNVPVWLAALALLSLCTLVNVAGIRQATWVSIFMVCVEVGGLALVAAAGFGAGEPGRAFARLPEIGAAGGDMSGILAGTALIFFVFMGFEDVANLSEEARTPRRTIPRALILGALITTGLYLLVAVAVTGLQPPQVLAESRSPLTAAAGAAAPWMGQAVAVSALFATASTALIALVSISRLLYGMARDGDMPAPLASTLPRRQTPWAAALVLFAGACLLLPLGQVKTVASVSSFGVLLVFAGVQAALIALRFRAPDMERHFRVPLSIGRVPVLPVLGIAACLALLTRFEPVVYLIGGGVIAGGGAVYAVLRTRK